jgi:hypothetical protein
VTISMFTSTTDEENKFSWLLESRIPGGKILVVQRTVLKASTLTTQRKTLSCAGLYGTYYIS